LDETPADEAGGYLVECGEDISAPFVSDGDATEASEPGEGPLDHPSMSAEALAALDAASGDARDDPPPT
jgi:hypothetical protein